tara:strand:+ start:201 stop:731 length:531 start_codon:yes stop_codon:yes gene_type:complete
MPNQSVVSNSTGGKILNISQRLINQTATNSTASQGTYTPTIPDGGGEKFGITVSPLSATSKILFTGFVMAACPDAGQVQMEIMKDGSPITDANGQEGGSKRLCHSGGITSASGGCISLPINYLMSPGSTTPFEFHIRLSHESGSTRTIYINRTATDGDNTKYGRYVSVFTAMELAS